MCIRDRHRRLHTICARYASCRLRGKRPHCNRRLAKSGSLSIHRERIYTVSYTHLDVYKRQGLTDYVPGLCKHVYTGTRADVKRALPPAEMGQALDIAASLHRELKEAQIWFALPVSYTHLDVYKRQAYV